MNRLHARLCLIACCALFAVLSRTYFRSNHPSLPSSKTRADWKLLDSDSRQLRRFPGQSLPRDELPNPPVVEHGDEQPAGVAANGSVFSRIGATEASIRFRPERDAMQKHILDYARKIAFDPSRRSARECRAKNLHLVDVPVMMIGFPASKRTQQAMEYLEGCVDLTVIEGVDGWDRAEVIRVADAIEPALRDHRIGCTLAHLRAVRTAREVLEKQGGSFALVVEDDVDWETSLELWDEKPSGNGGEPLTLTQWADLHTSANKNFAMVQLQYITGESEYENLENRCNEDCKRVRMRQGDMWGTTALLYHKRGLDRLFNRLWRNDRISITEIKGQTDYLADVLLYRMAGGVLMATPPLFVASKNTVGKSLIDDSPKKYRMHNFAAYQAMAWMSRNWKGRRECSTAAHKPLMMKLRKRKQVVMSLSKSSNASSTLDGSP